MNEKSSYTQLDVWIHARNLVKEIYQLNRDFPHEELYVLVAQIRKSAISIPSNIAEGSGRNHAKDSLQYFFIARGSLYELETQLYLAYDQGYFSEEILDINLEKVQRCKKLLNGYINYFRKLS